MLCTENFERSELSNYLNTGCTKKMCQKIHEIWIFQHLWDIFATIRELGDVWYIWH